MSISILIAEENPVTVEVTRSCLEDFGFQLSSVNTFDDLMIALVERAPDLLLLDKKLIEGKAHVLLEMHQDFSELKILLMSRHNIELGVQDRLELLQRPFTPLSLLAGVYGILGLDLG